MIAAILLARTALAGVLPDDRADVFYSKYSGGGMDITGESVLVRKKITENFAVEANYFIDKVSGASVDILSNASPMKDTRKQKTVSVEYLHDKTTYNASFINSVERDYISNTTHISLSQDMFGDLTTVTLGFSHTGDKVGDNGGTANKPMVAWVGHADTRSYAAGISQILTKNLIAGINLSRYPHQYSSPGAGQVLPTLSRRSHGLVSFLSRYLGNRRPYGRSRLHASHWQDMDFGRASPLLPPEQRHLLQRFVQHRRPAELRSPRPESCWAKQHHGRRQSHLGFPARWLADL
jgi:hypothetical protein